MKLLFLFFICVNFIFAQDKIVLKLTHVVSPATPKGKAADLFSKRVSELSNGNIEIKVYPNSTLYGDYDELKALKLGYADIVIPAISKFTDYSQEMQVLDLPFLFRDLDHVHSVLDGEVGSILKEKLDSKGFTVLSFWDAGFKSISADKEIKSPNDLDGLKIRIMNSSVIDAQFRTTNSQTVVIPFSEVYLALKNNVVNGLDTNLANFGSKKFYEVQKSITLTNHAYFGYAVVFNHKSFESLSNENKKIIYTALKEATDFQRDATEKEDKKILDHLQEIGFPVLTLSDREKNAFADRFSSVYTAFKDIIDSSLISKIKATR